MTGHINYEGMDIRLEVDLLALISYFTLALPLASPVLAEDYIYGLETIT